MKMPSNEADCVDKFYLNQQKFFFLWEDKFTEWRSTVIDFIIFFCLLNLCWSLRIHVLINILIYIHIWYMYNEFSSEYTNQSNMPFKKIETFDLVYFIHFIYSVSTTCTFLINTHSFEISVCRHWLLYFSIQVIFRISIFH